ncbi:hypothetical protein [Corallibacter sp.]|uniref:hypothetical protein n=1 Tax=Corallibacter sp. TaxID=2038084 RepID=UPI003AB86920
MQSNKNKIVLHVGFLLMFFCGYYAVSQNREYVVTKNNDTIYGKLMRTSSIINPSKIGYVIKDMNGEKHDLHPKDVKLLRSLKGVDGDCVILPYNDDFFIKEIISGRICVYQHIDNVIYLVSKDGGKITYIDSGLFWSPKKAHAQIRALIMHNSEILKIFDSMKGSEKNVFYIINKYNAVYE